MPHVSISGISINFPFEPYDVQKKYMEKVIECLQKGINGILESPTGTGKTLCLLCATLAWLEIRKAQQQALATQAHHNDALSKPKAILLNNLTSSTGIAWDALAFTPIPKIIYSSRTHSQLSQAVQELKRSDYKHMKACVIGSRDQLCIHPDVVKESNSSVKIHMCRAKVTARTCHYYNNLESNVPPIVQHQNIVVDIEDLVTIGKKSNCCPYFLTRNLKQESDIIFMPYNYLLDPKARKSHAIEMAGNVVIFDEAHNVEKMCEESVSFELSSQDIAACISEITQIMRRMMAAEESRDSSFDMTSVESDANVGVTLKELCVLKTLFCVIEQMLDSIPLESETNSATFPGNYIFEFLNKVELTEENSSVTLEILDKLIHYLNAESTNFTMRRSAGLQRFTDMIKVIFNKDKLNRLYFHKSAASYKVYVCHSDSSKRSQKNDIWMTANALKQPKTLNYWCFNPGIGMQSLLEEIPRCVLLTSGTLSPLDTFAAELQISLPVRLENPHIIKKQQLWVGVVCHGPDGSILNSSYQNRSSLQYIASLGNTIVNFARIVPKGLLVFFPSYYLMNECKKNWEASNVWQSLGNQKTIFMETQNQHDFAEVMEGYYKSNSEKDRRGGVFLAVCRGKVSEGLDFADDNGRAVIITGLPFPPLKDPKVNLKMRYLNETSKSTKFGSNGSEWYRLEASRVVNQAIGRVIRHKDDLGAIILCDNRFGEKTFQSQLSSWLRPHIQDFTTFGASVKSLSHFFKQTNIVKKSICGTSIVSAATELTNRNAISSSSIANTLQSTSSFAHILHTSEQPRPSCSNAEITLQESAALDWTNKQIVYLNPLPKPSRDIQACSVFGALEEHETKDPSDTKLQNNQQPIIKYSGFEELAQISKKRKFNVIKPQQAYNMKMSRSDLGSSAADSAMGCTGNFKPLPSTSLQGMASVKETCCLVLPPSDSCCEATSTYTGPLDKQTVDAKTFLMHIKKYASQESYIRFRNAVRKYSEDYNLKDLMDAFASISHHPEILKNLPVFRVFVPKAQRRQFNVYLEKITKDIASKQ